MTLRKLEPKFHERIWGSHVLQPWFPNPASSEKPIGEVWFQTEEVPLLVKFLFTTENLSVQVHPDDAYAALHHASRGKTEMWHVLAAKPGAKIAAGFRSPVTPVRAREAAVSGEIETLLDWHAAAPGDTFFIPAGTVHAIGAGLTICEIQQLSDVTYRLYDYGRAGLDGQPRPLHLEHGFAVSELKQSTARTSLPVRSEFFVTEKVGNTIPANATDQLVIAVAGSGQIDAHTIRAGEVLFIPAGANELAITGDLEILRTFVPIS